MKMMSRRWLESGALLALMLLLMPGRAAHAAAPTPIPTPAPVALRADNRLGPIDNYIVYYGKGQADILKQFDLAIVQPDTLTPAELADVQTSGTRVVAYLSVGEAEGGRPWWPRVDLDWILGRNENWGSLYINANEKGWQDLLLNDAIPTILRDTPFDGLFLDTLDTVDVYGETKPGMIELVRRMRAQYPDLILVQNRGFSVLDQTAPLVDAVMFESMSTDFDFGSRTYSTVEREEEPAFVRDRVQKYGIVGLVLDYALPQNLAAIKRSYDRAQEYGFVPYVSTIDLDTAYVHDFSHKRADVRAVQVAYTQVDTDAVTATVTLANFGLADSANVPVRLLVGRDHALLMTDTVQLASGATLKWPVAWPGAPADLTLVRVEAGGNVYETTFAGVQPPLALADQRLRQGNGPDLSAYRMDAPPTIDADFAEWAAVPVAATIDTAAQVGFTESPTITWDGPQDLSAVVKAGWDDDALYLAIDVTDDAIVQRLWGEGIWKGDHVEVWIDSRLQADFDEDVASDDDMQFGFSPGSADGAVKPDLAIWQPALVRADYETQIGYQSALTETGYRLEVSIPWKLMQADPPRVGMAYGITVEPSDTDTPRRTAQELMMSTSPASPAAWGNATLRNNLILKPAP